MISTSVATSTIIKLGSAGFQRLGSVAFQKMLRVFKIDAALKGKVQKSSAVKTAIDDFVTVIGNFYQGFDHSLADFLDEMERSGLITVLIEDAILDRRSESTKLSFLSLHRQVVGESNGDPDALYEKMCIAFSVSVKELCQDKGVSEYLKAIHHDLHSKMEKIDDALCLIARGRSNTDYASIKSFYPKLAKGLVQQFKSIRIETNKGPRLVDIRKIYIAPNMKYRKVTDGIEKIASITKDYTDQSPMVYNQSGGSLRVAFDPISASIINYTQLRSSFFRVVILGDPGGGKSTICQNICYDLAKQSNAPTQIGGRPVDGQLQKFPFRIILRSFERARVADPQLTIIEYLIRDLRSYVTLDANDIQSTVISLVETGRAVLAFDGLDEILISAQRREFVDLVSAFCEQYPLCPTIVTSRLVGYDDAPLPDDFEEIVIDPFTNEQVTDYVKNFMSVVAGKKVDEAVEQSKRFVTSQPGTGLRHPYSVSRIAA